ncbi:peptidoglycan-binding protein [Streptomyces sp. ST2-7A]|uniref:peptidoglycan-binding protein n=1 Tax=Streptomyces sp. ST2-7A TaxID=2907214 RepID=UPI001F4707D2|nr:peptidoglycan-binding protein [Streptomyces sp. ST2-7A]MCE7080349.1 peptidoglycan-binding protein [Streptomyces sp. ST2-7A]
MPAVTDGEGGLGRPVGAFRGRVWAVVVTVGAALLIAGGAVASWMIKSPAQAVADTTPPEPTTLTFPVERRLLTDSVVIRGTVVSDYSVQITPVVGAGEGTAAPVVTRVPVSPGTELEAGRVLMEISGRPVFVLPGELPAYRDLRPGVEGQDVEQLQKALRSLGHDTKGDRQGFFGPGTKTALVAFYETIGYFPPEAVEGGAEALEAARRRIIEAERMLEDAEHTLASTVSGSGTPGASGAEGGSGDTTDRVDGDEDSFGSERALDTKPLERAVSRADEDLAEAREELVELEAANGPMLPAGEVVYVPAFPARVDMVSARVGTVVSGSVMTVSSGDLVVHAQLREDQRGLISPGLPAIIHSELVGTSHDARIVSVSDVRSLLPETSVESGQTGGYLLVAESEEALPHELAGQDVRVTIETASTGEEVLVVPITAVSAGADGRTSVTVLNPDGTHSRIMVEPGTVGNGFVAVRSSDGDTLAEGQQVITGVSQGAGK